MTDLWNNSSEPKLEKKNLISEKKKKYIYIYIYKIKINKKLDIGVSNVVKFL